MIVFGMKGGDRVARQYTKELIKREFLALLEEKSFHSITIAMLAERCEISRNTFYYHYDDVYSLVKEIFADELVKADAEFNATLSWEERLLSGASFLVKNKRAAQNLFQSIDKKDTDAYLFELCESVMRRYVEALCGEKGIRAKADDKRLVTDFYRAALVGLMDKWVQEGMQTSPEEAILRIGQLFDGNIERSLRISASLGE
ncbi:TetR/AcrR family transcriptional regulator [Aedoeadaptatus coli]|uniref:TetR/AcrR family transcriptional regulator n=1 Tax=Aedoeadaptatus coli TaxID=2058292 RepID=UPI001F21B8E8|nr:TetR/AcrR family transcriptional regulator [Peptoniphilus coli]